MADLKDMAYTKSETKARNKSYGLEAPDATTPTYSWGLNIRLEQSELDKLGISDLPEAGAEMSFDITCKVTKVEKTADEKNSNSVVNLQITKMGIEEGEAQFKSKTKKADSVMAYNGGKNG